MKRLLTVEGQIEFDAPNDAPEHEVIETLLQKFMEWPTGTPGLRVRRMAVSSPTQRSSYTHDAEGLQ